MTRTRPSMASDDARRSDWRYRLGTLLIGAVLLTLWEVLPRSGLVSAILLPPFSQIAVALAAFVTTDFFARHLFVTLGEITIGFAAGTAIGFTMGMVLAVWPPLKRLTYPFVVAFQAVPKVIFAPLFISWFGFGPTSKVMMAVVISFFPVLINTMIGLESVPENALRLMRSLQATRLQIFRKLSLPYALPAILAGVKAALTFAVIGAIVAEFAGASEGLGYLLDLYNYQLRIDRVFAVTVVLAAIGAGGYFLVEWLDRRLVFWRGDDPL